MQALEHVDNELAHDGFVDGFAKFVHQRNEARHVGALLICRQGNGHRERGNRVLRAVLALNHDRQGDAAHANAVDGNVSAVLRRLNVRKNILLVSFHSWCSLLSGNEIDRALGVVCRLVVRSAACFLQKHSARPNEITKSSKSLLFTFENNKKERRLPKRGHILLKTENGFMPKSASCKREQTQRLINSKQILRKG